MEEVRLDISNPVELDAARVLGDTRLRVVGYTRVSSEEQAASGLSLKHQAEKIKAYCAAIDLNLVEIYEDAGRSGGNLRRPGMQEVLALVDGSCIDGVVILKLDRLTRSVRDLGDLIERFEKTETALIAVQESINTATAAGRLIANVMASIAQWEREITSERTKAALDVLRAQGKRLGSVPYGWRVREEDEQMIPDSMEQCALTAMIRLRNEGMSWDDLAVWANKKRIRTKRGKKWHHASIARIVTVACTKMGIELKGASLSDRVTTSEFLKKEKQPGEPAAQ